MIYRVYRARHPEHIKTWAHLTTEDMANGLLGDLPREEHDDIPAPLPTAACRLLEAATDAGMDWSVVIDEIEDSVDVRIYGDLLTTDDAPDCHPGHAPWRWMNGRLDPRCQRDYRVHLTVGEALTRMRDRLPAHA